MNISGPEDGRRHYGTAKALLTSKRKVYGESGTNLVRDEVKPTKCVVEQVGQWPCWDFAFYGKGGAEPFAVVRFGWLGGVPQKAVITEIRRWVSPTK